MLQIFAVLPVKLAKSEDCDFSCTKLALQKISVSCKYKSSQEISTILMTDGVLARPKQAVSFSSQNY